MSYYNITRAEMESFLFPLGFIKLELPDTQELVYAKIVKGKSHDVSLRIYTAIDPNGVSRPSGEDAIRVIPFVKFQGQPLKIAKARNVKRIDTWQQNLNKAIDSWDKNLKDCPACGFPLIERKGPNGNFLGCSTWKVTGCTGKVASNSISVQKNKTPLEKALERFIKARKNQTPWESDEYKEFSTPKLLFESDCFTIANHYV